MTTPTNAAERTSPPDRVRAVHVRTSGATMERRADGTFLIRGDEPLEAYPRVITERLVQWAERAPDRVFVAKRGADGAWRTMTYAETLARVRHIAQALLDRKLTAEHPLAILSENNFDHLLLMLAGQHVGVPTASIAPAYALVSADFNKLRHVMSVLTPGAVFVASGARYRRALEAVVGRDTEVIFGADPITWHRASSFEALAATEPTAAVDAAHAAIQPDDIAKLLFSSGSTDVPKAVINTHRMICSNQQMILQEFRFLADEPPVILDWLPWNHTAGGNHNIGMALYNGGTFYIDEGKATAAGVAATVQNLREIAPTIYFNVPKGYEELLVHLRADRALREKFFSRLQFMFYAAAGMAQPLWKAYRDLARETIGERILMCTGLGATETAPMAIQWTRDSELTGVIGIPVPGVELKLVPIGAKIEARVKGPSVTPGYWRNTKLTAAAFDEEGYYRFGDAVRFVDPTDINKGLIYDGRFAEDFKMASGTWVNVGPLRTRIIHHFAPYVRDVVITGHDRDFLGMLVVPDLDACRKLASGTDNPVRASAPFAEILGHENVARAFTELLESFAAEATGASNRVERAILLEEPPALDRGEITDKGSLNQRAILEHRAALVEEIYAENPPPRVLRPRIR
ncbi:MAG TPA: feruloyl-CoA synthase [Candidatus Acidoferrales bacterium]|nr:feruloyl-CoA synthase [Candidatus Acidoferrales bacterium]